MRWTDLPIGRLLGALWLTVSLGCRPSTENVEGATPAASTSVASSDSASASAGPQEPAPPRPQGPPPPDAPLATLRAFATAHPSHPATRRLRQAHDQRLRPCPNGWTRCEPRALIVAQGALDRARAYPEQCLDCADRKTIERLAVRLDAVVQDLETRQARHHFQEAMGRDLVEAEQVLADSQTAYANWRAHAQRRLEHRLRELGGTRLELDESCHVPPTMAALISPQRPTVDTPVRVLLTGHHAQPPAEYAFVREDGTPVAWTTLHATDAESPVWWLGSTRQLPAGRYRAILRRDGHIVACQRVRVRESSVVFADDSSGAWTTRRGWSGEMEDLYSVWLSRLFDAPEARHWHGLFELTRDPQRNILFNHLGLAEDSPQGLVSYELEPDCADGPYFLRAYFAWKLGLPFGWHECRYDERSGSPKCHNWKTNESERERTLADPADAGAARPDARRERLTRMTEFLADLKERVMARNLRTRLEDEATDLYAVTLTRDGLRPGVVFADPYGHTLTLVRWIEQQGTQPGRLLAVDAQPDGTLAIKRFWRGNFVFHDQHGLGGHGFKAFRPVVLVGEEPQLLTNSELVVARGYGHQSLEQVGMSAPEFYARIQRSINPAPLDATAEYRALHEALLQQLRSRVQSIAVAEEYRSDTGGQPIPMPEGRAIFGTTGPWESYSTPCRDLRLLVGIDHLLAYPAEAGASPGGTRDPTLSRQLRELHRLWADELSFEYVRSDGSRQALRLQDVIARRKDLEMAYNPNDCPEVRWAAPEGSAERTTCQRRAPAEQLRRMQRFRHWFEKRYACG